MCATLNCINFELELNMLPSNQNKVKKGKAEAAEDKKGEIMATIGDLALDFLKKKG